MFGKSQLLVVAIVEDDATPVFGVIRHLQEREFRTDIIICANGASANAHLDVTHFLGGPRVIKYIRSTRLLWTEAAADLLSRFTYGHEHLGTITPEGELRLSSSVLYNDIA